MRIGMQVTGAALLAALALGCRGSAEFAQTPTAPSVLQGRAWTLVELRGAVLDLPEGGAAPFIDFDIVSGRATGHAGCNRFFGGVKASGASLSFTDLASTKMACPEPLMGLETRFLAALGETTAFRLEGEHLALLSGSTVVARLR